MATPYLGEIKMFGGNFEPDGWFFCDGRLLSIANYDALFNLIGTTYGGDGQETFALPDLRGRIPIHQGNGFVLSETGGVEQVTLTVNQIPAHNHSGILIATDSAATESVPQSDHTFASATTPYTAAPPSLTSNMSPQIIGATGGGQPHNNMMPYTVINFIIAYEGIFPSPA